MNEEIESSIEAKKTTNLDRKNDQELWLDVIDTHISNMKAIYGTVLDAEAPGELEEIIDKLEVDEGQRNNLKERCKRPYSQEVVSRNEQREYEDMINNETSEEKAERLINGAHDMGHLIDLLSEIGEISGSQKKYSPDELKDIIIKVSVRDLPLDAITREHGLRDKVETFLEKDNVEEKSKRREGEGRIYRTPGGDIKGRVVNSRPGGPHEIETPQGRVKVDEIDSIR